MRRVLNIEPLTQEAYAEFGDVIEFDIQDNDDFQMKNDGSAKRYRDFTQAGYPVDDDTDIGIFKIMPLHASNKVPMVERHPKGIQSMIPLSRQQLVIVVAPPSDEPQIEHLRAFITNGQQGITYRTGVWHCPLRSLCKTDEDYVLAIDHKGGKNNCDMVYFDETTDVELFFQLWH
ncbi:ureidoglycolate lyase [Vibrio sp. SCSIO 43137]|uniref:ureidoglycolate lyase n=1 Tax=Vibrio sp. SCSIO 43137 TaxID=3021011 RepID=UPI00230831EA|nr:ureidoglycolate lyase [Vibrio sp. SCSIO 43137]WCE28888.1 ureidoglycolate lyase [Vibrio sp. SCSIO 43137]